MVKGISREAWMDTKESGGGKLVPVGVAREFQVYEVRENVKNDKNTGEPIEYILVMCETFDEDGDRFTHNEFLELSGNRVGWTKRFCREIGRADFLMDEEAGRRAHTFPVKSSGYGPKK